MTDSRTDRIAREAARLIELGTTADLNEAIRRAAETLGLRHGPRPGHGRVRKHAQAMTMQALGDRGYTDLVRSVLATAEEVMTTLEYAFGEPAARRGAHRGAGGDSVLLVGRAAEGHVDAGAAVNIRLYSRRPIGHVAAALVEVGYAEPEFDTVETRHGRLNRLRFLSEGIEISVTRCRPEMSGDARRDLVTGKTIATMQLNELRQRLEEPHR
jgi:hypothetical protein